MELNEVIFTMFRRRYERENNYQQFTPLFHRAIGVKNEEDFCNALRTIDEKQEDCAHLIVRFENEVPFVAEFELIDHIKAELANMNIQCMSQQDITIFNYQEDNTKFLRALEQVVNHALQQESFFSHSVTLDFITKLIVWAYTHLTKLVFDETYNPKCIYYGDIARHEVYFLMLMYHMDIDVLYLNPLKEELIEQVETKGWSTKQQEMGILSLETYAFYSQKGTAYSTVQTSIKQLQQDVHDQLFDGTGMYKPWQFRGGRTKALHVDTTLDDVLNNWNEDAKFREGFRTKDKTVYVPCFFNKYDGVYRDELQYTTFVKAHTTHPSCLVHTAQSFAVPTLNQDLMYPLMFAQQNDGLFIFEEVIKLNQYPIEKYAVEVQQLIVDTLNECLKSTSWLKGWSQQDQLAFAYRVLYLHDSFLRLIDNFDFTAQVPKLVVYLNNEDHLTEAQVQLLWFLNQVGLDVALFNPSGNFNIAQYLDVQAVSAHRLDQMAYETQLQTVLSRRQSVLSKILRR